MGITTKVQNGRLHIYFPFDSEIINKLQQIPSAKFEKPFKCWSIPLSMTAYQNVSRALGIKDTEVEQWIRNNRKKIDLATWKFKTEPKAHQIEGIKFMLKQFNIEVK